jgi:membrane protease YdiL (CAAX protease family)
MISLPSLPKSYLFIAAVAVLFSLLQYYEIPYQFYFWEILIDLKIVSLLVFLLIQWKRKELVFQWQLSGIEKWQWKGNILWFFYPAAVLLMVGIVAFIMNQVEPENVDNSSTILLQTIFDIPAIFVFSVTSVFVEEFFFRSILFRSQLQLRTVIHAVLLNSCFWTIFYLPEIISIENDAILVFISVALFIFSYGFLLCILMWRNETLWYGYSFRIGISAILPLFVTSNFVDSGTFFTTDSAYFNAEGIVFSIIFFITAAVIYFNGKLHISPEIQKN